MMMMVMMMMQMMEFMRWCCTIDRSPIEGRGKAVVRLDNHPDHDDDDDHDHDDDDDDDQDDDDDDDKWSCISLLRSLFLPPRQFANSWGMITMALLDHREDDDTDGDDDDDDD